MPNLVLVWQFERLLHLSAPLLAAQGLTLANSSDTKSADVKMAASIGSDTPLITTMPLILLDSSFPYWIMILCKKQTAFSGQIQRYRKLMNVVKRSAIGPWECKGRGCWLARGRRHLAAGCFWCRWSLWRNCPVRTILIMIKIHL